MNAELLIQWSRRWWLVIFAATLAGPASGGERQRGGFVDHLERVQVDGRPTAIAISDNASSIAVAVGTQVTLCNENGRSLHQWQHDQEITNLDLSPDGEWLAVADGTPAVAVYRRSTGKIAQRVRRNDAADFLRSDGQQSVALYPDGKTLISSGTRMRIFVSDISSGQWQYIMFVKYDRSGLAVSPDGASVVLIGKPNEWELAGQLSMFRVNRGLQPLWTRRHEGEAAVTSVAFSSDSSHVVTSGAGDGARVWEVASGDPVAHVTVDGPVIGCCFFKGTDLFVATPKQLALHKVNNGNPLVSQEIDGAPWAQFVASIDGTRIVSIDDRQAVNVWSVDIPTHEERKASE